MDMSVPSAAYAASQGRRNLPMGRADEPAHDGERCRALLRRLLREVASFARQQRVRQVEGTGSGDAALWIQAVERVCDARIERLDQTSTLSSLDEPEQPTWCTRADDVVAEAMVQELLGSLAAIRLAETEAMVLDEVENVESLRRLRFSLQREEAELRRAVTDGAGDETQLAELQRLLRHEFVQELAQSRAEGLADSLHNEASLHFAWETIQDQKKEIVRLRVENEQLKSNQVSTTTTPHSEEPLHAIQQLQLQLSSHPDTQLRLLDAQLSQLEVAMGHREARVTSGFADGSRYTTANSGVTLSSSRDDADDEPLQGSMLLPSHLTTAEVTRRDCAQCRRHVRAFVECQSEVKQLRAQAIADEDALVRAEQAHAHMKREHTALTTALVTAKQKQEELRQMILDITDDKLRAQSASELQQRKNDQQIEILRRQLKELEAWRERSSRERLDSLTCQEAVANELARLKMNHEKLESERDSLTMQLCQLRREVGDAKEQATVEKAKSVEALNALAVADNELVFVKKSLRDTQDEMTRHERAIEELESSRDRLVEKDATATQQILQVQDELNHEVGKRTRLEREFAQQIERISALDKQLLSRDSKIADLSDELSKHRIAKQNVDQVVKLSRLTQQRLEQSVAELEGRLNQSEETRSVLQNKADQALQRIEILESKRHESTHELKRVYEECQRLELSLADARAEVTSLQAQILEHEQAAAKQSESHIVDKAELNGAVTTATQQVQSLREELSETKTTILMWMGKYHTAVNGHAIIEEQLHAARDELANTSIEHARELEELHRNCRDLAEDKERVLEELTSTMDDKRSLASELECLKKSVSQLERLEHELRRNLSDASEELRTATEAREHFESLATDRLAKIEELGAELDAHVEERSTASQVHEQVLKENRASIARHVRHFVSGSLDRLDGHMARLFTAIQKRLDDMGERLDHANHKVHNVRRVNEARRVTKLPADSMVYRRFATTASKPTIHSDTQTEASDVYRDTLMKNNVGLDAFRSVQTHAPSSCVADANDLSKHQTHTTEPMPTEEADAVGHRSGNAGDIMTRNEVASKQKHIGVQAIWPARSIEIQTYRTSLNHLATQTLQTTDESFRTLDQDRIRLAESGVDFTQPSSVEITSQTPQSADKSSWMLAHDHIRSVEDVATPNGEEAGHRLKLQNVEPRTSTRIETDNATAREDEEDQECHAVATTMEVSDGRSQPWLRSREIESTIDSVGSEQISFHDSCSQDTVPLTRRPRRVNYSTFQQPHSPLADSNGEAIQQCAERVDSEPPFMVIECKSLDDRHAGDLLMIAKKTNTTFALKQTLPGLAGYVPEAGEHVAVEHGYKGFLTGDDNTRLPHSLSDTLARLVTFDDRVNVTLMTLERRVTELSERLHSASRIFSRAVKVRRNQPPSRVALMPSIQDFSSKIHTGSSEHSPRRQEDASLLSIGNDTAEGQAPFEPYAARSTEQCIRPDAAVHVTHASSISQVNGEADSILEYADRQFDEQIALACHNEGSCTSDGQSEHTFTTSAPRLQSFISLKRIGAPSHLTGSRQPTTHSGHRLRLKACAKAKRRAVRTTDSSANTDQIGSIPCGCRAARILSLWARVVERLIDHSTRRRWTAVVNQHQRKAWVRARVCERFAVLTLRLLASGSSREVRSIALTRIRSLVMHKQSLLQGAREQRAITSWTRFFQKLARRASPLRNVVRSLMIERTADRHGSCHFHFWQLLAWRLRFQALHRGLCCLVIKCLSMQRREMQLQCLRLHFSAWNGLVHRTIQPRPEKREDSRAAHEVADVSTDLQMAMHECVTLLRRVHKNHGQNRGPNAGENQPKKEEFQSAQVVDLDRLIQVLLEGSKQTGEWKEAMDKKIQQISIREGQLHRLEAHCIKLERIVESYQQLRQDRVRVHRPNTDAEPVVHRADEDGQWWLTPNHPVQEAGQSLVVDKRRYAYALEKERRHLNQCNIVMLERVITQLKEAKDERIKLHERLRLKARSLENAQRYCRGVCVENLLLRAFFRWRLHAICSDASA